jgi:hypothetical protein
MAKFERLLPRRAPEIQTVAQVTLHVTNWPMERETMLCPGKIGAMDSKAEEIGDFDENLPAIIQKSIGNVEQVTVGILAEAGIEILKVAVVTEVDGGARMEKIREESKSALKFLVVWSEVRFWLARTAAYWPMKRRENSRLNW